MAISRIQQSQISGSLSYDISSYTPGSGLLAKTKLSDDLNALRSLIQDVKGEGHWYAAATQDLAQVYGAMRAQGSGAAFQGAITTVGSASIGGLLAVAGNGDFNGDVYAKAALGVSGSAVFAGGVAVNTAALDVNAGMTANEIKIDGDSVGALYLVGASGEIADSANLSYAGSRLSVTGSMGVSGALDAASLAIAGLISATSASISGPLTAGSAAVSGNASVGGTLAVTGATTLSSTLNAGASTLSSLTVSGATALNGGLTMDGDKFIVQDTTGNTLVGGTLGVMGAASLSSTLGVTGAATFSSTINVSGGASLQSSLGVMGPASFASSVSANSLIVSGAAGLTVNNGILDVNAGMSASLIKIDGDVAQRLYIVGASGEIKDEQYLTYDGTTLKVNSSGGAGGLWVTGDAQVDGNLQVKGAFTYIETENMKVKDAFIYLATGSNGSVDSGIVLSKGAGATWDLIVGQDGGAGELVFAKVAHNASGDSPADLNGAALVPAWISEVKLGGAEGALSGSLKWNSAGIKLESVDAAVAISAGGDLSLSANGNAAISFASAAQVPDASFQATTVVGMLNELRIDLDNASAGGNLKKASYVGTVVSGGVLDFGPSGQNLGTLSAAQHKLVDVFVNGVLMAPSYDLTGITTTSVTFDGSYSFTSDDVITVVIRG